MSGRREISRHARLRLGLLLLLLLAGLLVARAARANLEPAALDQVTRGTLLFRSAGDGGYRPAPELRTEVTLKVTGMVARATLRQRFRNPGLEWVEGTYVFPLPETAAVDTLRLVIGERVIEGQVRERAQAQKAYRQARDSGKRAALVEQQRPNVFTTAVANVGPGEEVTVEIAYQQAVDYRDGAFQLRFPLVVGPRYIPGQPLPEAQLSEELKLAGGWARATDQVPDAPLVTPPVAAPGEALERPVSIEVELRPGFPLAELVSQHHAVRRARRGELERVALVEGPVPADRDFELTWRPVATAAPRAALFAEQVGDAQYALLTVLPPARLAADQPRMPRDLVLVIDVSGSMHGTSIAQAKAALQRALERLDPGDRFNVVRFNNSASTLYPGLVPAHRGNLDTALRWVGRLEATGGTEMAAALRLALDPGAQGQTGRLRQVVFLTDGAVGNEEGLFRLISERLGAARLFTVGIGSAPNSHFMRRAAEHGRGSFVHVGDLAQVAERIDALLRKLETPALTDVRIDWPEGVAVEAYPDPVPDLYFDEPVQVVLRLPRLPASVPLRGRVGLREWQASLELAAAPASGIAKLWARQKLAALEARRTRASDPAASEALRAEATAVALGHGLVSRYTSLVAIDVTPARAREALLQRHAMATLLPHGWDYGKVFGVPQTATAAPLQALAGL
ncbi:MAG TPA: marine proteobacterial sortase target protein, partial [Gammaproteobacteria bacterium]